MVNPKDRPLFKTWWNMLGRCHRPTDRSYPNYGGRGIKVCEQWRNSSRQFEKDMGPRPSPKHMLGRIDNDGDYCPQNCRWETPRQQVNNRRVTNFVIYRGEQISLGDLAITLNIKYKTLWQRLARNADPDSLTKSVRKRGPNKCLKQPQQ